MRSSWGASARSAPTPTTHGGDVNSFYATDNPEAYVFELATTLEAGLRRLGGLPEPVVAACGER
jgi:hypothetical protein